MKKFGIDISVWQGDADGPVYESTVDNNVWSPADYPAGWQKEA